MGRLATTVVDINAIAIPTPITGVSNNFNVYNYIDEFGNVTQIKKDDKTRLKYYPDAMTLQEALYQPTVIGVSDDIPMGCGDISSSTEMAYAIYE